SGDMARLPDGPADPSTASSRRPLRWWALLAAVAVIAAACGGDGDDGDAVAADPAPTTAEDVAAPTPTTAAPAPAGDLVAPTETGEPFDLSGGATSSDDGVTIVADDPRSALIDIAQQATEPWPTDWTRQTVGLDEFLVGLPRLDPRDGIPPIDSPRFEPIAAASWLGEREPGALVRFNGEVRFYPLSILTRHEIVNDRFGDVPVAVTFCPLCNTALTFDRRVDGQVLRFGVSGLLRNSDLVMWDDATTSLWQQITGEGVVGTFAGTQLETISTSIAAYGDVLEDFPEALSLSQETGFPINYGANGYVGYSSSQTPFLFDGEPDPRFPALSRVVGVSVDGVDKAYPFEVLGESPAVNDELGDTPIAVLWGGDTADALDGPVIADSQAIGSGTAFDRRVGDQTLTFSSLGDDQFTDAETGSVWSLLGVAVDGPLAGEELDVVTHRNEFWFAWARFFPDAAVYG
ncbi:MAG: DUF3179 domain-containing protein, partial [Actinomycetota bacterium]